MKIHKNLLETKRREKFAFVRRWNANIFLNSSVVLLEWTNFVEKFNEIAMPNVVHKTLWREHHLCYCSSYIWQLTTHSLVSSSSLPMEDITIMRWERKQFKYSLGMAFNRRHLNMCTISKKAPIPVCPRPLILPRFYETMTNLHIHLLMNEELGTYMEIVFHNKRYAFAIEETQKCNEWTWI